MSIICLRPLAAQQVINQCRNIADLHLTVTIHITTRKLKLLAEVAWIALAAVDVSVGSIRGIGILGHAHATD